MNYIEAKEYKNKLELLVEEYSNKMNLFPKSEMGLISQQVKETEKYQETKLNYDRYFKQLQEFNKMFVKQFKKEYQKERSERRKN